MPSKLALNKYNGERKRERDDYQVDIVKCEQCHNLNKSKDDRNDNDENKECESSADAIDVDIDDSCDEHGNIVNNDDIKPKCVQCFGETEFLKESQTKFHEKW